MIEAEFEDTNKSTLGTQDSLLVAPKFENHNFLRTTDDGISTVSDQVEDEGFRQTLEQLRRIVYRQ